MANTPLLGGVATPSLPADFTAKLDAAETQAWWAGSEHIREISESTRAAIQGVIVTAINQGIPPVVAARMIRPMIGLTAAQMRGVLNYRANLINNPGVNPARIDKMVDQYTQRKIRDRALTISRTETMWALNAGQISEWEEMAKKGDLPPNPLKEWIASADACTEICLPLDGEKVPLKEAFLGGYPFPPAHPRCRCTIGLTYAKPGEFQVGPNANMGKPAVPMVKVPQVKHIHKEPKSVVTQKKPTLKLVTQDEFSAGKDGLTAVDQYAQFGVDKFEEFVGFASDMPDAVWDTLTSTEKDRLNKLLQTLDGYNGLVSKADAMYDVEKWLALHPEARDAWLLHLQKGSSELRKLSIFGQSPANPGAIPYTGAPLPSTPAGTVAGQEALEIGNQEALRHWEIWVHDLALDESMTLRDYTQNGYKIINKALRDGKGELTEATIQAAYAALHPGVGRASPALVESIIKQREILSKALTSANNPATGRDMVLFRGGRGPGADAVYTDRAFGSLSADYDVAASFVTDFDRHVVWRITVPANSDGLAYVAGTSSHARELEFLANLDAQYVVTSIEKDGAVIEGGIVVDLVHAVYKSAGR